MRPVVDPRQFTLKTTLSTPRAVEQGTVVTKIVIDLYLINLHRRNLSRLTLLLVKKTLQILTKLDLHNTVLVGFSMGIGEGLKLAEQMDITFTLQHGYELPSEALPRDAYVLSVQFGFDAIRWKTTLEQKSIPFDAIIHPQLPMIEFALKDIPSRLVEKLKAMFGRNVNDLDTLHVPDDLQIIPPADHTWAESRQDSGVEALAYNLFTKEVCQQLQMFQESYSWLHITAITTII
ncbi:MAG TPA: hypothetical protein V6C78_10630 [Crinalium sp.]